MNRVSRRKIEFVTINKCCIKMSKNKSKPRQITNGGLHSVVKFEENECKMFECIWDGWFVDENRNRCYWPPSKGKSYMLRVLSKEKPEDTWKIYPCTVISAGHGQLKCFTVKIVAVCESN